MIRFEAVSVAPLSPALHPAGGAIGPTAILLRDLDLSFAPGESHLILGANGSGKTTLLRVLAGLLAPASGRVLFYGKPLGAPGDGRSLWPDLAILFEEPDPQFLTDRVEAEVAFGLESLALPPAEIRARAADAMASFGLRGMEAREPQSLSAGEKARTLLAAMLAGRPRALALDQSLAHLDPAPRRSIESVLVDAALAGERVLIRTHQDADPPFPGERLWVLHDGALSDATGWLPEAVLAADRIPFPLAMRVSSLLARHGLWSGPLAMHAAAFEAALLSNEAGSRVPFEAPSDPRQRERIEPGSGDRRGFGGPPSGRVVLAFRGVGWTAPRARDPVLRDIDFEVREGEIVALIGASGSGKTTLLKLAAGLTAAGAGEIRRDSAAGRRPPALALEFPERQLFGRTVSEDVAAGLWVRGVAARERLERANAALSAVGLDPIRFAERIPSSLSEGEKRRAALAGFLVDPAPILLLDEPTAGLDPEGRRAIRAMLRRLADQGTAVLFASHDLDFVLGVADRAVVIGRDGGGPATIVAENMPTLLWSEVSTLAGAPGPAPVSGLAPVPGPAPDAILIGRALRARGMISSHEELRDSDSVLAVLARSLASGGTGTRGRAEAASEATSAPG